MRIEDVYPTGIRDLWSALGDSARLERWIGSVGGDLRPGGRFTTAFTSGWQGTGVVEVREARRLLRGRASRPGCQPTVMEAQLNPKRGHTRLVIEERGLPLEDYADHGAGWQTHAEDLRAHVVGQDPQIWLERWRQLTTAYLALLGR